MKRVYKLQEIVAHPSSVNCLKIGRKSSGVLATGGDDKKVNLWAIGKSTALLSLSGHQSPVECVTFDSAEEVVVAGASSGTLKLWDLEEAKVVRTLTGHRSNCLSVDFHPFGEFVASGSLDTNLKIWDIRQKSCIHTYKGHTRGVSHVRFSPDGRLVVSGCQDGTVKLWDLTAGKQLHEFTPHDGAVSGLEFHPSDFLLATSAADRTVKFWDLETFRLIDTAGPEATGVRAIAFPPDGRALFSATQDSLRVWTWEPVRQHDCVEVSWSKVADLSLHDGKLVGCTISGGSVGIFVVDLLRVRPFSTEPSGITQGRASTVAGAGSARRSMALEPTQTSQDSSDGGQSSNGSAPLLSPRDAPGEAPAPTALESRAASQQGYSKGIGPVGARSAVKAGMVTVSTNVGDSLARPRAGAAPSPLPNPSAVERSRSGGVSEGTFADWRAAARDVPQPLPSTSGRPARPPPIGHAGAALQSRAGRPSNQRQARSGTVSPDLPKGLDIDAFTPVAPSGSGEPSPGGLQHSDSYHLEELLSKHDPVVGILSTRLSNLQVVRALWGRGDVRGAVGAVSRCGDPSVAVDLFEVVAQGRQVFKLEHIPEVLLSLEPLLESPHEKYTLTALQTLTWLLQSFGQVVRDTCSQQAASAIGVDLNFEARRERCMACRAALLEAQPRLQRLGLQNNDVGRKARQLNSELLGFSHP